MLTESKAPGNSREIFKHLVGEKITACFGVGSQIWIVCGSGSAFVVNNAAYWVENAEAVEKVIDKRRD